MKIFLVIDPSDITGRHGYGRAVLDAGHPNALVSFATPMFERRRQTIFPEPDDPVWDLQYQPPPIKRAVP